MAGWWTFMLFLDIKRDGRVMERDNLPGQSWDTYIVMNKMKSDTQNYAAYMGKKVALSVHLALKKSGYFQAGFT